MDLDQKRAPSISFSRRLAASKDVLVNGLGDESVLLNLENETYYGLDEVGTRMWQALIESESIRAAYDALLVEYDVEAEKLRADLEGLIRELVTAGLLEVQ